jgi:hypothetical protein
VVAQAELDFNGTSVISSQVAIGRDNGATHGLLFNVPTSSTNGYEMQSNGATIAQMTNTGALTTTGSGQTSNINGSLQASPTINGATVLSYCAPGYTAAGVALGAGLHRVLGSLSVANQASSTITIPAAMGFTSASTFALFMSFNGTATGGAINKIYAQNVSGTSVNLSFTTGGGNVFNGTVNWVAVGT